MVKDSAQTDRLIVVGVVKGAHGVRGDVRVKPFTEDPNACFDYGPLLTADGEVLLEPVSARPAKDHFIVKPVKTRQKEEWDALKGTKLYVPREAFDAPDEDEFYIEDLVGLQIVSEAGDPVGRIKAVQDYGAGDLLEIAPKEGGKSVFVPFSRETTPDIDLETGRVTVVDFATWADESGSPEGQNTP